MSTALMLLGIEKKSTHHISMYYIYNKQIMDQTKEFCYLTIY
jgi:hypothetical protein